MGKPAGDEHRKGTVLYRVLWRECDGSEATWEPKSCLTPELIAEFEESPAIASTSHLWPLSQLHLQQGRRPQPKDWVQ
jgi:hypothetical protein